MRLILSLLLAVSISYAADVSTIAHSRSRPAILRSLSTGIYLQATVIFEGHRAKVRFNRGGQIVLDLDNPVTTESEEIMGVDENQNYWAVYVDSEATEPGRSASFGGALPEDLLDLPQRDGKDSRQTDRSKTPQLGCASSPRLLCAESFPVKSSDFWPGTTSGIARHSA
jgi:hypothetical protein